MTEPAKFNEKVAALDDSLRAKLGVRGRGFGNRLRKAGRLLPKRIHRAGRIVTEAETKLAHPKLARQVEPKRVETALDEIKDHLATIDPAERRKGAILGWLGGLVFNLILVAVAVIVLLRWQGVV